MSMQEYEQESQESPEQSGYQAGYTGSYEVEQQKIHPYGEQRQSTAFHVVVIILSSLGFSFSIVGIVASALVLEYANGVQPLLVGGILGLVSSILAMLAGIAVFVLTTVTLARRIARRRGSRLAALHGRGSRVGSQGNLGW